MAGIVLAWPGMLAHFLCEHTAKPDATPNLASKGAPLQAKAREARNEPERTHALDWGVMR